MDEANGLMAPLRLAGVGLLESRVRYDAALAAAKELQVVALIEEDVRLARTLARELGRSVVFPDLEKLLESETRPDALLISLPPQKRAAFLTRAVAAHLPALCDAPFAPTLTEFDTLLQAAETAGVLLLPAFARPFDPWIVEMTSRLAAGEIGTLRHVRCDWSFPVGGTAAVENGGEVEERNWIVQLPQFACQTADLCRRWLGDAQTVSADIDLPGHSHGLPVPSGSRETLANLIVSHERGQSTHHLSRTRSIQSLERYLLTGTQGDMELTLDAGETAATDQPLLRIQRTGQKAEFPALPVSSLRPSLLRQAGMLRHFAAAARGLVPPQTTAADARAALEIVHAAYLSTRDNLKVSLPLRRSPAAI